MYQLNKIPLFQELEDCNNILLAGAGGGFDIFSGIPLYFNLRQQGKNVTIANLSFTWLNETTCKEVTPYCYKVTSGDMDKSGRNYFPEKYLTTWLGMQGEKVDVFAFGRCGVQPLRHAYKFLIANYNIDAVVLVDGGTDSLMFGDEEELGTPSEDICSMAAVYRTGIKKQFMVNVGFGVDHFHGVSHYLFLENVAALAKDGGYLGLFQMTKEMDECQKYIAAVEYVNERMKDMESIVSNSIVSALQGEYGNYHKTNRAAESVLWINPLMTIYWCFDLRSVIKKNKYYEDIKLTKTMGELNTQLSNFRRNMDGYRKKQQMPI